MTPDEFRRWGHELVDWVAAYQEEAAAYPVAAQVKPREILKMLPATAPERGEDFAKLIADVNRIIMPGITHWQSPNFFGFFPCNNSGPSILGELLAAGLGVQGMLWATSPSCTELETRMLDWMVDLAGLPKRFKSEGPGGGVIQDSASSAVLCALLAARERASGGAVNREGGDRALVAYASGQAHSSVEKAVKIAGIGVAQFRKIETDAEHGLRPDRLAARLEEDRQAGRKPFFVSATLGTTSSNGFDPLEAIGPICREYGAWLHVDGAMSGTAGLCPEFRHLQAGLEWADSYCFNPHKWMFTNFDCDCFFLADRAALIRALTIVPEYLRNQASESGQVIDYRDWQIPLGRRFRALKLWFVLRYYGAEGLRYHIRRHVELAREFAGWVRDSEEFELAAPAPLNLVCFAHRKGDDFNRRLHESLNASGKLLLTHTVLNQRYVLRLCVGQTHTEREHVQAAWECIRLTAAELE